MAFEGLTRAWSSERILYRDPAWAVVDKPAGVAPADVGGESEPDSLPARLFVHGLGKVQAVLGPPERASGAALVVWGEPSDDRWPAQIAAVRCMAAVDGWSLGSSGLLNTPAAEPGHADGCRVTYRVSRRHGQRALIELEGRVRPEQVPDLLARHGQPLVGDAAAGAPAATRLLLHVLELRGSRAIEAPLPVEFESWLGGAAVLPPTRFESALRDAALSRQGLSTRWQAYRWLGEEAGEIAGVCVERYGDYAVLYVSSDEAARHERAMAECLLDHGARGVYLKRRVRADLRAVHAGSLAPELPLVGLAAPERFQVRQAGLSFDVQLGDGHSTGLFLDQRVNWERMRRWASGAAFLNLFCYTGAFTIAAAAGGAASTVSVDLAGRALSRLRDNLELNAASGPAHRLLKADVVGWLARAGRTGRRFDWIVLDPPSFGTRARGVLSTRRDQPELLAAALGLLQPGGGLLAVSHHRQISERELGAQLAAAAAELGRELLVEPLVGGWDCSTLPGVSGTKSVLARLA